MPNVPASPLCRSARPARSWPLRAIGVCALIITATGLPGCSDTVSDRDIDFVTLPEVRKLTQGKPGTVQLIDPRAADDYAAGHIPGAIHRDIASVSERKDAIDPALARYKNLVVYGDDPGSGIARAMAKRLMRSGHKGVKMFSGGMAEWRGAGLKVETSPSAATPTTTAPR